MSGAVLCWWCGAPADRLCDTLLLADATDRPEIYGDTVSRKVKARPRVLGIGITCDAVTCPECSKSCPVRFAINCGMFDDAGEPIGRTEVDTIDACPFCAANPGLNVKIDAGDYRIRARAHADRAWAEHKAKLVHLREVPPCT